jgi:hypothetical protein
VPTTTPLQQLFALNSPLLQHQSAALARRLKEEVPEGGEARIRRAYLLVYGRPARESEVRLGVEFLDGREAQWTPYAQALLCGNEFLFID